MESAWDILDKKVRDVSDQEHRLQSVIDETTDLCDCQSNCIRARQPQSDIDLTRFRATTLVGQFMPRVSLLSAVIGMVLTVCPLRCDLISTKT